MNIYDIRLSFLYSNLWSHLCPMNQITVRDMLAQMETGALFSISYLTYDRQRKRGGRVEQYSEAVLLRRPEERTAPTAGERTPTTIERKRKQLAQLRRNPQHHRWYTRNIQLLVDGHPTSQHRKIHPPLVILFNSQIVVA